MSDWTRQQLEERLLDYLYDELDADDRAAFEAALVAHPEVAAELESHRATRRAFAGVLRPSLPVGTLDAILASAETAEPSQGLWSRWGQGLRALVFKPAFALACVGLLVGGVAIYGLREREVPQLGEREDSQRLPPVAMKAAEPASTASGSDAAAPVRGARSLASEMAVPVDGRGALDDEAVREEETLEAKPREADEGQEAPPLADKKQVRGRDDARLYLDEASVGGASTNQLSARSTAPQTFKSEAASFGAQSEAAKGVRVAADGASDQAPGDVAPSEAGDEFAQADSVAQAPAAPPASRSVTKAQENAEAERGRAKPASAGNERRAPAPEPAPAAAPKDQAVDLAERLWWTSQQQLAAGAWSDLQRTVAELAKLEGETTRVKELRARLKDRPSESQQRSEQQPPEPAKAVPAQ